MERRNYLKTILAATAAPTALQAAGGPNPIQLHVDLSVDPAREKEMLKNFETIFRPAASKQPGYICTYDDIDDGDFVGTSYTQVATEMNAGQRTYRTRGGHAHAHAPAERKPDFGAGVV